MKLHETLAIIKGRKAAAEQAFQLATARLKQAERMHGLIRTYAPHNDDGDRLPNESKAVHYSIYQVIAEMLPSLDLYYTSTGQQDVANTKAQAPVVVDGVIVLPPVPATYLLWLEKQLAEFMGFAKTIPILELGETWVWDKEQGVHVANPTKTSRTQKVQKPLVLYPATDKHPAQVQLVTEDINAGEWTNTKLSGAMPRSEVAALISRITKLQEAVKVAREQANAVEVQEEVYGPKILGYLFPSTSS